MIEPPLPLLGFLFFVIAFTRYLESKSSLLKKITSAVMCTLTGIVLANLGVIPYQSPMYQSVFDIAIPKGPLPDWVWQHEKAGGGMMTYNGSHQLDRMMWLSGSKVADVQALTASLGYRRDLEDTALAHLRFENGAVGSVVQHKSVSSRTLEAWETLIYGSEGAIRVRSGTGVELSATGGNELIPTLPGNRFVAALEELAAAIREERSPRPDGRSSLHTLAYLKALYQSARQGTRVPVLE